MKFAVKGEVGSGSIMINSAMGGEDPPEPTEAVSLTFALRYLNLFNKSYSLSQNVKISMAAETPLVVEYVIESSTCR